MGIFWSEIIRENREEFNSIKKVKEEIVKTEKATSKLCENIKTIFSSNETAMEKLALFKNKYGVKGEMKSPYEAVNQLMHRMICLQMVIYLLEKGCSDIVMYAGAGGGRDEKNMGKFDIEAKKGNHRILGEVFWVSKSLLNRKLAITRKKFDKKKVDNAIRFIAFNKLANPKYKPRLPGFNYYVLNKDKKDKYSISYLGPNEDPLLT